NKARRRAALWLRKYGITPEQYDLLLAAQNGRCAICRGEEVGGGCKFWHVDHDHTNGAVRGQLCSSCNTLLVRARDSTSILSSAMAYLKPLPVWSFLGARGEKGAV